MKENKKDNTIEYADIIHLPRHESKKHPRMSIHDRAAQFMPFSALTGHGDAIKETSRLNGLKEDFERELYDDIELSDFSET